MKGFLNKKAVRDFALSVAKEKYKNVPVYIPTRVSEEFFLMMESHLKVAILQFVASRPTKGKTL